MIRKDHIMKRIAEFAKALAQVRELCSQADYNAAETLLRDTCAEHTGLNLKDVEAMDNAAFEEKIIRSQALDDLQLKMLADVMYEKLTFCLNSGEKEKQENLAVKCRQLYQLITERSPQVYDFEVQRRLAELATGNV